MPAKQIELTQTKDNKEMKFKFNKAITKQKWIWTQEECEEKKTEIKNIFLFFYEWIIFKVGKFTH